MFPKIELQISITIQWLSEGFYNVFICKGRNFIHEEITHNCVIFCKYPHNDGHKKTKTKKTVGGLEKKHQKKEQTKNMKRSSKK